MSSVPNYLSRVNLYDLTSESFSSVIVDAANSGSLTLTSAASVVVDAPQLYYKNSTDVSTSLNATLDAFTTSLASFTATLEAADDTLQANIDAEETARLANVATLESADTAEETARIAADDALSTRLDNIEALFALLNSSSPTV